MFCPERSSSDAYLLKFVSDNIHKLMFGPFSEVLVSQLLLPRSSLQSRVPGSGIAQTAARARERERERERERGRERERESESESERASGILLLVGW